MIEIKKSPNADTRGNENKVTKDELKSATESHIEDVNKGMKFFADMILDAGKKHDNTKLNDLNDFFEAFSSGKISDSNWYKKHTTKERHHLIKHVPGDVTLVDIFEHLVDCTMAGLARSGDIYDINLPSDVLQLAHKNTVDMLKKNVKVSEEKDNDILNTPIKD